ncbi:hypothetical protein BC827DRAFT_489391 [Russula dissimulans]|nr:hypothetical protein BC827DRAFT_489391 [Russula dissimulans]
MRNVILFIVAVAALVADAKPSQPYIAALLPRQLPGSSTSTGSSGVPGLDPSSTSGSDCESACAPLSNTAATCSTSLSCLCSQTNYDALSPCLQCVSPDDAQTSLSSFVSDCQQAGYTLKAAGSASPGNTTPDGSSAAGAPSPTTKEPAGRAKSNGSVVGSNALGVLGLSAVAAAVTIATLGVSFV